MKTKLILSALLMQSAVMPGLAADDGVITLDLTKAETELQFDAETGAWAKTFSEEDPTIDSQVFSFIHSAMTDYATWWGFTVSNSADNLPRTDYIKYQYSNMAKGGIALDADGKIKLNEHNAPVCDPKVPYIVAYYSAYMAQRPVDIILNDGLGHEAVGCYVNLNSYAYYPLLLSDSFCRVFTEGDKFTLTIHGVAPDETEKTVDVDLASFTNGFLTAATGWTYVDLSPLGAVNEIYFTMNSTDTGAWGMNTPGYFCLDKLMVKAEASGIASVAYSDNRLSYNRAEQTINAGKESFIGIYNVSGQLIRSTEAQSLDVSDLEHGVYIARCGNSSLKFIR